MGRQTAASAGGDRAAALMPRPAPTVRVLSGRILSESSDVVAALAGADVLSVPVAPAPSAGPPPTGDGPGPQDDTSAVQPRPGAADAAAAIGVDLAALCERLDVKGTVGEITRIPLTAPVAGLPPRLMLVGVGSSTPLELRRAAASLARATRGQRVVTTLGSASGTAGVRAVVEGLLLGAWKPARVGRVPADQPEFTLIGRYEAAAVDDARAQAGATLLARDLAVTPSSIKNPAWLAERARQIGTSAGLSVRVWGPAELAAQGFGGILAVGAGSASPPRLVQLDYRPEPGGAVRAPHVVLVGKGITFDTGGLSIKNREAMVPMKTDMAGAAVVLAVLAACRTSGVRARVTGLLPLAENAFGGGSYRPSDVLTGYGGTTIEVTNTDAEGRLVLADALAYADAALAPDILVDVATLTGAATQGLGRRHAALYTDDERLAASLTAAAASTGEGVWRLPLVEEYRESLDSDIADLRHVPVAAARVQGGSITAALFLREFTGGRRWAHLDIAGTARSDSEAFEVPKGATGYGARLLLTWLARLRSA